MVVLPQKFVQQIFASDLQILQLCGAPPFVRWFFCEARPSTERVYASESVIMTRCECQSLPNAANDRALPPVTDFSKPELWLNQASVAREIW
jgi:hypothetical protein